MYTITVIWQEISRGFEEIDEGRGEIIFRSKRPSTEAGGARVWMAQAREPLADRNGRPRVVGPAKGGNPEKDPRDLEIRRL